METKQSKAFERLVMIIAIAQFVGLFVLSIYLNNVTIVPDYRYSFDNLIFRHVKKLFN